jgi:hypothetical protein
MTLRWAKTARLLPRVIGSQIRNLGFDRINQDLLGKPLDTSNIEILRDPAFQASIHEVQSLTILDTERLANLWQLCRMSNPDGAIIELGTYKSGCAIHLSNSCPGRRIYVCDTFEGFGNLKIDMKLDRLFNVEQFTDTSLESVKINWNQRNRDVVLIKGYFPESATGHNIQKISFLHLDLDLYESTLKALCFLKDEFLDRSIIILDDYLRGADGVMQAVTEFEEACPEWRCFPIFPGQGMMLNKSWFGCGPYSK